MDSDNERTAGGGDLDGTEETATRKCTSQNKERPRKVITETPKPDDEPKNHHVAAAKGQGGGDVDSTKTATRRLPPRKRGRPQKQIVETTEFDESSDESKYSGMGSSDSEFNPRTDKARRTRSMPRKQWIEALEMVSPRFSLTSIAKEIGASRKQLQHLASYDAKFAALLRSKQNLKQPSEPDTAQLISSLSKIWGLRTHSEIAAEIGVSEHHLYVLSRQDTDFAKMLKSKKKNEPTLSEWKEALIAVDPGPVNKMARKLGIAEHYFYTCAAEDAEFTSILESKNPHTNKRPLPAKIKQELIQALAIATPNTGEGLAEEIGIPPKRLYDLSKLDEEVAYLLRSKKVRSKQKKRRKQTVQDSCNATAPPESDATTEIEGNEGETHAGGRSLTSANEQGRDQELCAATQGVTTAVNQVPDDSNLPIFLQQKIKRIKAMPAKLRTYRRVSKQLKINKDLLRICSREFPELAMLMKQNQNIKGDKRHRLSEVKEKLQGASKGSVEAIGTELGVPYRDLRCWAKIDEEFKSLLKSKVVRKETPAPKKQRRKDQEARRKPRPERRTFEEVKAAIEGIPKERRSSVMRVANELGMGLLTLRGYFQGKEEALLLLTNNPKMAKIVAQKKMVDRESDDESQDQFNVSGSDASSGDDTISNQRQNLLKQRDKLLSEIAVLGVQIQRLNSQQAM